MLAQIDKKSTILVMHSQILLKQAKTRDLSLILRGLAELEL